MSRKRKVTAVGMATYIDAIGSRDELLARRIERKLAEEGERQEAEEQRRREEEEAERQAAEEAYYSCLYRLPDPEEE